MLTKKKSASRNVYGKDNEWESEVFKKHFLMELANTVSVFYPLDLLM